MASSSLRVIIAALVGNSLIALTKFTAAALTGSSAMLSEGIHSLVDTGNQVLLLHGLRRSARPPDEEFPFGHGKEVYFWSFVVAILIFALGSGLSTYEGVRHLLHPRASEKPLINYAVLGISLVFEFASWYVAMKEFSSSATGEGYIRAVKKAKNPTLFVVFFEDSAAMLGLVAAFLGVLLTHLTGNPLYDGLASIVIGVILGGTAIWLAYETKGLLIGQGARPEVVESIRSLSAGLPGVNRVGEVLTLHMGPDFVLVNISLDFDDDVPAGTVERTLAELDRRIKQRHPEVKRVFAEPEQQPACEPKP